MKKLIAIAMAAAMLLTTAALAGCGEDSQGGGSSEAQSSGSSESSSEAAATKTLTLDNHDGVVMTMEYPDTLTYDPESHKLNEHFGQKTINKFGGLTGDKYTLEFQSEKLYENAYKTFDDYVKQFKSSDIYEETKVGDYTAYIEQGGKAPLHFFIVYNDPEFIDGVLKIENGTTEDYKALYEGEFKTMFDSIKFEGSGSGSGSEDAGETITTENEFITVTAADGWHKGESKQNNALTLYNEKIGPVSWVVFDDTGYVTVEDQKKYVLAGYSNYEFKPITIGNNNYEILTAGTNGDVSFLVAERSDSFSILIELRNVTVEQATPLLETVVIE